MGYPSMDLSHRQITLGNRRWEQVVHCFLKRPDEFLDLTVTIHPPSQETMGHSIAVLYSGQQSSSALASTPIAALIKALVELGESYIFRKHQWNTRSGLAGGLITSSTIQRAKYELLERDSFFYHYRNQIPFLECRRLADSNLLAFTMATADPMVHSILITDSDSVQKQEGCLLFGTGAHKDPSVAIRKATEEYAAIHFGHRLRPNRCKEQEQDPNKIKCLADFHHLASRDTRNRAKFHKLCAPSMSNQQSLKPIRSVISSSWAVTQLESPLKYFKYYHVTHPNLIKLKFGEPEHAEYSPSESPLYHPFW